MAEMVNIKTGEPKAGETLSKFNLMQEEAVEWLSKICGCEVKNDREQVFLACRKIKKDGSLAKKEAGKYWSAQWYWAESEKKYHAM